MSRFIYGGAECGKSTSEDALWLDVKFNKISVSKARRAVGSNKNLMRAMFVQEQSFMMSYNFLYNKILIS
jgi:hypothetical protein